MPPLKIVFSRVMLASVTLGWRLVCVCVCVCVCDGVSVCEYADQNSSVTEMKTALTILSLCLGKSAGTVERVLFFCVSECVCLCVNIVKCVCAPCVLASCFRLPPCPHSGQCLNTPLYLPPSLRHPCCCILDLSSSLSLHLYL